MPSFSRLIRFQSASDAQVYFADLGSDTSELPSRGSSMKGYLSFDDVGKTNAVDVILGKLLAPLPYSGLPIYCVGLNYKTHAEEAKLPVPANAPLWTKPTASLANPGEDIPVNKFCASSFPDYEGELVFVTSRECRDLSPDESKDYILGYTAGNDLSCRLHQLPEHGGGQFYFAKAFDKFAPMGPTLISPEVYGTGVGMKLITRVNGEVRQEAEFRTDFIWSPAQILSRMSQGTTIPAGTAVMTGTPAGVGAFMSPRRFLSDKDVIEVEISKIGTLRNKIVFA